MTKVLYVLGRGRSGSTIFASVIGQYGGFFSTGELRYLWDPIVKDDVACACGEHVSRCPIWGKVLEQIGEISIDDASNMQRQIVTERKLLRSLRYRGDGSWRDLDAYVDLTSRVYTAIHDVTGASVIVDSSKRPSYGAVLRHVFGSDVYWLHLIRDPRASAHSWGHSRHASVFGQDTEVQRRGPIDSTIRWDILNLEAEALQRKVPAYRASQLRYEDFLANPEQATAQVINFIGEESMSSPFLDGRTASLKPSHALGGNPSKMSVGRVAIHQTTDWISEQKTVDRWLATAVALPFLRKYGYRLTVESPPAEV